VTRRGRYWLVEPKFEEQRLESSAGIAPASAGYAGRRLNCSANGICRSVVKDYCQTLNFNAGNLTPVSVRKVLIGVVMSFSGSACHISFSKGTKSVSPTFTTSDLIFFVIVFGQGCYVPKPQSKKCFSFFIKIDVNSAGNFFWASSARNT